MREFTQEEVNKHNALTEQGWELVKGELLLDEPTPVRAPGWFTKRKLKRAIACFEKALAINPQSWSSQWALGKIYQRLMQPEEAYRWFRRAHEQNPTQTDVAREAGLAALDLGKANDALVLCKTAVNLNPNDPGLIANLAWAYLISGDVGMAQATINRSVDADPSDTISRNVQRIINEVASGARKLPKTLLEISALH